MNDHQAASVGELLERTQQQRPSAANRLEAEMLLAHVLNCSRATLYAWPDKAVTQTCLERFEVLLNRRERGEPMAYLTGRKEFWSLDLEVTPATLIPRPETELAVSRALALLPKDRPARICDLGTGSGAIAIAIASERPDSLILATDKSTNALAVAQRNAQRLKIHNVTFMVSRWLEHVKERNFDLIVSNPPYVAKHDPHLKEDGLPFEPIEALACDENGFADLRTIAERARGHLNNGGFLVLEHGYDQGPSLEKWLAKLGFKDIHDHCDLAGIPRTISAQYTA